MLKQRRLIADQVAASLFEAESAIDAALAKAAGLAGVMPAMRADAGLSALVGQTLPYDTLDDLRSKLMADHPTFGRIDYLPTPASFDVASLGKKGDLGDIAFASSVRDPYLSNPITRASVTMAELSAQRIAPVAMAAE